MPDHRSAREEIAKQVREWQRKKNDPTEWHVTKPRRETHKVDRVLQALLYGIYPLATFAVGCAIGWMMHR